MRRVSLLLMVTMATLLMASGVALAFNVIQCKVSGYCMGTTQSDLIKGTPKQDVGIYGREAPDSLYGYGSEDSLNGEGGNDKLFGGGGSDSMGGDEGNDRLEGGAGGDRYSFGRGWGHDTVVDTTPPIEQPDNALYSWYNELDQTIRLNSDSGPRPELQDGTNTVNWGGNVIDKVWNSGYGDDDIIGNGAPNYISSDYGADQIRGGGGDDIIYVDDGVGNDTVYCGTDKQRPGEKDTVYYDAGDTVAADCEARIENEGGGGGY